MQTIRKEGVNGLYKGATPPLVGWMCMDSLMLGSLTQYRRLINEHVVQPRRAAQPASVWAGREAEKVKLPVVGHGVAGMLAGWTVSFIAAPVEHVKARLQVQYSRSRNERLYTGPIDCTKKIFKQHHLRGLWHGLGSTLLFRTFFFFVSLIRVTVSLRPESATDTIRPTVVGKLRPVHSGSPKTHISQHTRSQLLGRRAERPGVLDYQLPVRCRQAENHDR
jgi:hypothetical protein